MYKPSPKTLIQEGWGVETHTIPFNASSSFAGHVWEINFTVHILHTFWWWIKLANSTICQFLNELFSTDAKLIIVYFRDWSNETRNLIYKEKKKREREREREMKLTQDH